MPAFESGVVVRVPFPYVGRERRQHRPALVVSRGAVGEGGALLWVLMITSAENRPWPGDVSIDDSSAYTGLPVPSVVRSCKIATIAATSVEAVGRLGGQTMRKVTEELGHVLGARLLPPNTRSS